MEKRDRNANAIDDRLENFKFVVEFLWPYVQTIVSGTVIIFMVYNPPPPDTQMLAYLTTGGFFGGGLQQMGTTKKERHRRDYDNSGNEYGYEETTTSSYPTDQGRY